MAQAVIQADLVEFTRLVGVGDLDQGMGAVALQAVVEGYLENFDNMANSLTALNNYIVGHGLTPADYAIVINEINNQEYMFDLPQVPAPMPQAPEQPAVPDVAPAAGGSRKRKRRRKRSKSGKRKTSKGGSRRVRKRSNRKGRNPKSRRFRKSRRTRKTRTRRTRRNRKRR
jgi:hypothetical protein